MVQPFTTTVVGSMPKPVWLYQQRPLAGPGTDHHGSGADWNPWAPLRQSLPMATFSPRPRTTLPA